MGKEQGLNGESEDVKKAQEGDMAAFDRLIRKHTESVRAFVARGLQPTEVDDIIQTTWIKVGKSLPNFQGKSAFSTWVKRIARNVFLDGKRESRHSYDFSSLDQFGRTFLEKTPDVLIDEQRPDRHLSRTEYEQRRASWLNWALTQLSETHQTVIKLQFIEGYSYQKIAEKMGCSIGTVMSRRFYAMKKLAELAKKHNGNWDTPE